jgi:hypothetical protein
MQLNQPVSESAFERQTRAVAEQQQQQQQHDVAEEEHQPEEPEPEEDADGAAEYSDDGRGGPSCCIPARAGLGVAAVVQLGLSAAAVFSVAPTWPSRPSLLAWKCVVLFAVWLSAAMENRTVATASFIALCAGSAALLALWSEVQQPRALCNEAYQHSCAGGTRESCCYRCAGFPATGGAEGGGLSVAAWESGCSDRMVGNGKFCWYPVRSPVPTRTSSVDHAREQWRRLYGLVSVRSSVAPARVVRQEWCDSSAVGAASLFGGASSINACVATCMCWCQWALLAPRTKEENVEARGKSFAGKSMMQMGKSMSQMPSFLFRPQKGGGAIQQARVAPAPSAAPVFAPAPAPTPAAAKKPPKPAKRTVSKWPNPSRCPIGSDRIGSDRIGSDRIALTSLCCCRYSRGGK